MVAAHDDGDDVLTDVVDIAFDGRHEIASAASLFAALPRLDVRLQEGDGAFHGSGRFHDLRQKHLSFAEEFSDAVHALHERPFNDFSGLGEDVQCFGEVGFQELLVTPAECFFQPFLQGDEAAVRRGGLSR